MTETSKPENGTSGTRGGGWQATFLGELAETGNVKAACARARVGRTTAYRHRQDDGAFARAWADAVEDAGDVLEAEAVRRAVTGTEEPVYWQGKAVGTVRKYSDQLLILLLKAAKRDKYADLSRQEISGNGGAPLALIVDTGLVKED